MKSFFAVSKTPQASPRLSNARGAVPRFQIRTTITSPPKPSHRGAKFLLNVGQYLCLILAFVCLGYVALDYGGARVFQSYQSWRFDRLIGHQPASHISSFMKWIDQEFSAFMNEPVARPAPDRSLSHPPAVTARAPMAVVHPLPNGSLIGRLEIPRIGISVMVLEGDDSHVLRKAVGHLPSTAFPGEPGNVVLAGHRDTFFRALSQIRKDDEITFTTTQGAYIYQVGSIEKVGPRDVQVLDASVHPTLTLITCYPFYYVGPAPKRFVVQANEMQAPPKVMNGSESTEESTEAQPVDPPSESLAAVHKVFGRVRSWLGSISSRLHQN
jgi:sortase A